MQDSNEMDYKIIAIPFKDPTWNVYKEIESSFSSNSARIEYVANLSSTAVPMTPPPMTMQSYFNADRAVTNGAKIKLDTEVIGIEKSEYGYKVTTTNGKFECRCVINCSYALVKRV